MPTKAQDEYIKVVHAQRIDCPKCGVETCANETKTDKTRTHSTKATNSKNHGVGIPSFNWHRCPNCFAQLIHWLPMVDTGSQWYTVSRDKKAVDAKP